MSKYKAKNSYNSDSEDNKSKSRSKSNSSSNSKNDSNDSQFSNEVEDNSLMQNKSVNKSIHTSNIDLSRIKSENNYEGNNTQESGFSQLKIADITQIKQKQKNDEITKRNNLDKSNNSKINNISKNDHNQSNIQEQEININDTHTSNAQGISPEVQELRKKKLAETLKKQIEKKDFFVDNSFFKDKTHHQRQDNFTT